MAGQRRRNRNDCRWSDDNRRAGERRFEEPVTAKPGHQRPAFARAEEGVISARMVTLASRSDSVKRLPDAGSVQAPGGRCQKSCGALRKPGGLEPPTPKQVTRCGAWDPTVRILSPRPLPPTRNPLSGASPRFQNPAVPLFAPLPALKTAASRLRILPIGSVTRSCIWLVRWAGPRELVWQLP